MRPVYLVYLGSEARLYFGIAASTEHAPAVLWSAVGTVAHRVSGDMRQVLANGSSVVKKSNGHLRCNRWILLFRECHAWRLSISLSHHRGELKSGDKN